MEANKEEQLLALLDAKKDEFCTANNNDCKSCLMEDGAGLKGEKAFYMGSIMKYLYRYPYKGNPKEDLMKAEEYIRLLRESYESDTKGDDK